MASEVLPDLTPGQAETVAGEREHAASYGDPAFDALLEHTRSWGQLMPRWAANHDLAPPIAGPADVAALIDRADEAAGSPVVLFAELLEREPVPKYANVERWLVAPLDPHDASVRPDRAAIVFVDRTVSSAFSRAQPGWFVHIAARFYKPMMLPQRTTGREAPYASFVGASFDARQKRGESVSGLLGFVLLAIAVMIAILIVLLVVVTKIRARPPAFGAGRAGWSETRDEGGLTDDPAEALDRLAARADSADNTPDA